MTNQQIVGPGFGVFDDDIEIAAFGEDAGVVEFEFAVPFAAAAVLVKKPLIRIGALRDTYRAPSYRSGSAWNRGRSILL